MQIRLQRLVTIRPYARAVAAVMVALAASLLAAPTVRAQSDRDRQQMQQLQQMVQKLRQDNAELQQAKAKEIEKAKADAGKQLDSERAKLRAGSTASQREAKRLTEELASVRETLSQREAEIEKFKADIAQRDATLLAANQKAETDRANSTAEGRLLGARLKANTERADRCEAKQASAWQLSKEVIDLYSTRRLSACEPFTGLWRVGEEERVQVLRDRLFEARLDVPPEVLPATAK